MSVQSCWNIILYLCVRAVMLEYYNRASVVLPHYSDLTFIGPVYSSESVPGVPCN